MIRETERFRQAFDRRLATAAAGSFYGQVVSVDEKARICSVRVQGIEYGEVMLYAIDQPDMKGLVAIPRVGSTVLVSRIDGSDRLYVSMFSEVDKVMGTIGDKQAVVFGADLLEVKTDKSTLRITSGGLTLTRDASGLKKTLSDLCDALARLTVPTGVGPSGIPINMADFQKIKQDLNNYLED